MSELSKSDNQVSTKPIIAGLILATSDETKDALFLTLRTLAKISEITPNAVSNS